MRLTITRNEMRLRAHLVEVQAARRYCLCHASWTLAQVTGALVYPSAVIAGRTITGFKQIPASAEKLF